MGFFASLARKRLIKRAVNASSRADGIPAVNALTDDDALSIVAFDARDEATRIAAIRKLNDQSKIVQLALHEPGFSVRLEAIRRVTDENVLFHIAFHDSSSTHSQIAVSKISSQDKLAEIVRSQNLNVIDAALVKLFPWSSYQDLFALLAENGPNSTTRRLAAERISDDNVLLKLAATSSDSRVRETAAKRIRSESILAEAASCEYWDASAEALKRIQSKEFLLTVIEKSPILSIRQDAVKMYGYRDIVGGDGLDFFLESEVVTALLKNKHLRHSAVLQKGNQAELLEVAKEDHLEGSTVDETNAIEEARILAIYQIEIQEYIEFLTKEILDSIHDLVSVADEVYYKLQLSHHQNTRVLKALWWAAKDKDRLKKIYSDKYAETRIPAVQKILKRLEAESGKREQSIQG